MHHPVIRECYGTRASEEGPDNTLERVYQLMQWVLPFIKVTAAAKLFRQAMGPVLAGVNGMQLSSRMNGWLHPVIRSDGTHDWGERVMRAGDFSKLGGFEFNPAHELEDVLPFNTANHCLREGNTVKIDIPAFRLRKKKSIPKEATHYRLVSFLLQIDFESGTFTRTVQEGPLCVMGRKAGDGFAVEEIIPALDEQGCFWLVGILFYKMVGEKPQLIKGGVMRVMEWIGPESVIGLDRGSICDSMNLRSF